jgi:predicted nucleic acid-binding protein
MRRVGLGEAACLAIAVHQGVRLLSDDRRARTLAARAGVSVGGTLGILAYLVQASHLTLAEANTSLNQMITRGYRSPVDDLSSLL